MLGAFFSTDSRASNEETTVSDNASANLQHLKPADLPAPPRATARIVRACSDPDVSARALAGIVASDPVLTVEILRTANSALYGLSRTVNSAAHAVAVLGNRALRNLALCLAVRDTVRPNAIPGFNMLEYWEDTLRRAVGAKLLAEHVDGCDVDEAFTIGLLQDFGLLAMVIAMPHQAQHWARLRRALPDARRELETALFNNTHDEVAKVLAKTWNLPDGIAIPIAHHHKIEDSLSDSERTGCLIARGADLLAAVYSTDKKSSALERCRGFVGGAFGLDDNAIDTILSALPAGVEEAATALGLRVTVQPKLDDVMRAANRHLVEENLCYQEFTKKLERLIEEKDNLTRQLKEANERLEQLAHYDGLTGLMNRRRFHEILPAEIARHARNGQAISLVMVDLDHFKGINDTHGHPFGDRVLREVSAVIQNQLRGADIKARVGGEELAILLPESDARTAHQAVERVRKAIENLRLDSASGEVRVTASFGGCSFQGPANSKSEVQSIASELVFFADRALYEAKRKGRNRICWQQIAAASKAAPKAA